MVTTAKIIDGLTVSRVSSEAQKEKYGFDIQADEMEVKLEELGWNIFESVQYQESATDSANRPKFTEILQRAVRMGQEGKIQGVLFPRPDRLGRDGEAAFFYYMHILEKEGGLQVRFARDDVNPDDPHRYMLLCLQAFKSRTDAETIRQNTMRGKRNRALSGKLPGGTVPWPYDYAAKKYVGEISTGKPTINNERAEYVRRWVQGLLEEGWSIQEIKRYMENEKVLSPRGSNSWGASTISRILSNRALLGDFWVDDVLVINDPSLAIMTNAEFEAVRNIFSENKALAKRNGKRDYGCLRGRVYCHCGRKAVGSTDVKSKVMYWRCRVCRNLYVRVHNLWEEVQLDMVAILNEPATFLPQMQKLHKTKDGREQLEQRRDGIRAELSGLVKRLEKVMRMFEMLDVGEDFLRQRSEEISKRRQSLLADKEDVERALRTEYEVELRGSYLDNVLQNYADLISNADDVTWKGILRDFDVKITIQPKPKAHIIRIALDDATIDKMSNEAGDKMSIAFPSS